MLSVRPIIVSSGESIFAKFAGLIHNDQSEISFSIPLLTLPWQLLFVGYIHRSSRVVSVLDSGAAGPGF